MPVIHSAKKKMRQDKFRTKVNKEKKETLKKTLKMVRQKPTLENIRKTQSVIDKMAKAHLIHKNKAARLKSQIARLISNVNEKTKINVKIQNSKVQVKNQKRNLSSRT